MESKGNSTSMQNTRMVTGKILNEFLEYANSEYTDFMSSNNWDDLSETELCSKSTRAFLVRVEAELPGRVSSTTRERRLQVASSRPRRVRGAGLRELNVIDAAAVASFY